MSDHRIHNSRIPDTLLDAIRDRITLSDFIGEHVALKRHGREWLGHCPFHQERTPSFSVNDAKRIWCCFGCLQEDEVIWTSSGLARIGDVTIGDRVLDRYGAWSAVLSVERKIAPVVAIHLESVHRHPLLLTPDHTCLFIRKAHALKALPYLYMQHERGLRFKGAYRKYLNSDNPVSLTVTEDRADTVAPDDFFVFPVIEARNSVPLPGSVVPKKHWGGTPARQCALLPCNEEAAFLYGIYLAEGSTNPRSIRWTLHRNETYIAENISKALWSQFSLNSTLAINEEKNTCEVICSSIALAETFATHFGKGAANKKIPAQILSWPASVQRSLIYGYMDGDGSHRTACSGLFTYTGSTISGLLAFGIYSLAIQARLLPTLGLNRRNTRRNESVRQPFWTITLRTQERLSGFYQRIGLTQYYWSRVQEIAPAAEAANVVDITVHDSHSFVTRIGAVHNCGAKGDVVDFAQHIYRMSFRQAVDALASDNGLDGVHAVIDPAISERAEKRRAAEEAERRKYVTAALKIWDAAIPGGGTPVETYLRSRAITQPIPPSIRYHPAVHYRTGDKTFLLLPAMISSFTNLKGQVTAIHRTYLRRDGSGKADVPKPKSVLGDARGSAIWLGSIPVTHFDLDTVNVVEGIETGLSLQQMSGIPTIAAGSSGNMVPLVLPPLPSARHVIIGADNDANDAGLRAASAAATRWRDEERAVSIKVPQEVKDWNDVLRLRGLGLSRTQMEVQPGSALG